MVILRLCMTISKCIKILRANFHKKDHPFLEFFGKRIMILNNIHIYSSFASTIKSTIIYMFLMNLVEIDRLVSYPALSTDIQLYIL